MGVIEGPIAVTGKQAISRGAVTGVATGIRPPSKQQHCEFDDKVV